LEEVGKRKTEVGSRKSGIVGWESEVGSPYLEVGS